MNTDALSGWMTTETAASALNIREDYCRLLINNGKIKAKKLGRQWFVSTHEIRRYVRGMSNQQKAALRRKLETEE
jgi:excisionase family DNA binding protein